VVPGHNTPGLLEPTPKSDVLDKLLLMRKPHVEFIKTSEFSIYESGEKPAHAVLDDENNLYSHNLSSLAKNFSVYANSIHRIFILSI
jgi:hypothetical protein